MAEPEHRCPMHLAKFLGSAVRRWFHSPRGILGGFISPGMRALDVGCGPGFFSLEMARMVGPRGKVIAADVQQGMLDIVQKKRDQSCVKNLVLHKSTENRIGVHDKLDFVLVFYVLHEVADQDAFLSEIKGMLKPAGRVLIVEPKFHVSVSDFERSIERARSLGFKTTPGPHVFLSRSCVLTRGT